MRPRQFRPGARPKSTKETLLQDIILQDEWGKEQNADSALIKFSLAEQALQRATIPAQSKSVESMAAAAKAWAKEQDNFEMVVAASRVYILARRKTTELSLLYAPK